MSIHLNEDREAELLACILSNLDPQEDRRNADAIICDLIEAGLCDAYSGPEAQEAWQQIKDIWDSEKDEVNEIVIDAYKGIS